MSVLQWISTLGHEWLLVFDNADVEPDVVEQLIPPGNQGNILITSRNENMKRMVVSGASVQVDEMDETDAVSLLLKAASLDKHSDELRNIARDIVKELCYFPLAIDQAGAAIASGLCDIHGYLQTYSKHHHELLDDDSFKGASKYGCATYATWDLSFQKIKANAAGDSADGAKSAILIIQIFALLHHENIMEAIFKQAAEAHQASDNHNGLESSGNS